MAFTNILIEHDEGATDMTDKLLGNLPAVAMSGIPQMRNYLNGVSQGVRKAKLTTGINAVKASGTLTCTSVIATNTCVVGGVTFTCVASGATGNQFNIGGSDTLTAASLAAVIVANAQLANIVTATSALGVVTITALQPGLHGNGVGISSGQGTIVASAAALASGTNGTSYTYYRGGAV